MTMNAVTFETVVTAEHQLHLPAELPVGCRLRVTVEPIGTTDQQDNDGQTFLMQSKLGQTLLAIRQRAIAKGMKLQTVDEILDER
jgi:hypothetical protein